MTDKELRIKYNDICDNLAARKLKPAFDALEQLIDQNGLGIFFDEWRNLEQTYHYMLQYTVEGINDPERQKIYHRLILSVYQLTDKIYENLRIIFSLSVEYETKRRFEREFIDDLNLFYDELENFYLHDELLSLVDRENVKSESEADGARTHQQKIVRLFHHIWLSNALSTEETTFLRKIFTNELIHTAYKSLLISAVVLSMQRYFDVAKFNVLFDI